MNKSIFTLALVLISYAAFAHGNDKNKKNSEITPQAELTLTVQSFNVGNLQACTGEFEEEDAIEIFDETDVKLMQEDSKNKNVQESLPQTKPINEIKSPTKKINLDFILTTEELDD